MSTIAVNDAGDVMAFDGKEWKPATVAQNDRGERMAFDGKEWQRLGEAPSLGRQALDMAGNVGVAVLDGVNTGVNYVGTQAAKVAGGIAGVPRMLGDMATYATKDTKGAVRPADLGLLGTVGQIGRHMPTGEEMTRKFFDATGAPQVNLEGNIPGGKIIDAGVQGALSVPMMGGATIPALIAGAGGGAGSEIGGQLAEDTPYEIPARIGGALVGAGGATLATDAVRKGAGAVKALGEPLTKGGRDSIVGRSLVKQSADSPSAIARMENYSPPVPGFQIPAGKASRDGGLMAVEEVAMSRVPSMGRAIDNNNAVLTKALDALDAGADPKAFVKQLVTQDAALGARAQAALDALPAGADAATAGRAVRDALRGRFDSLTTARNTAVEPLYEAARQDATKVKPFPLMMSTSDAIAANKGELKSTAESVRKLLFNATGKPDRSAAGMMATRDAVTDMLGAASPGSKQQRMLMGFKDEIESALSVVPPERQARQTYADMSRPLDAFKADKGAPFVENVIEKDRFGSKFMLPAERVPSQFFRSGDGGGATMKEFLAANDGNQVAISAMRSFIADKAREAKDVKAFLQQNRPAIQALDPTLARQLEDAATTKTLATGFKASPAGRFIEGDLDAAVKSTLGAPDSVKRMQALRMSVGGSDEAVAGLRKAILDDFRSSAKSVVAEDATGGARMTANGAATWLSKNKGAASNVLTPDQVKALESVTQALKDQAATIPGRTGSPTFDRLATENIIGALVSPKFADAPILSPINKALGLVYGGANEATMNRLFEAIQDPKIAAALMKKATPGNVNMVSPMLERITQGAAVPAGRAPQ